MEGLNNSQSGQDCIDEEYSYLQISKRVKRASVIIFISLFLLKTCSLNKKVQMKDSSAKEASI